MNYLLKSSNFEERNRNAKKKVIVVAVILTIILLIMGTGLVRRSFFFLAEPFWKLENSFLNSSIFEYFKSVNRQILSSGYQSKDLRFTSNGQQKGWKSKVR